MLQIQTQNCSQTSLSFPHLQSIIIELTNLICITANTPPNGDHLSILHSNRGVLYYQSLSKSNNNKTSKSYSNSHDSSPGYDNGGHMGNHEWAHADFQKALEYNYLNYAAYFNMFSVDFVEKKYAEGLRNLCCSLSCLYLIRGKENTNEADINKCIKLTENNCEGRLLKALHYQKKGKHSLALNQINWILELEPHNLQILHVKNYIQSLNRPANTRYALTNSQQHQNQQPTITTNTQQSQLISNTDNDKSQDNPSRRLICTLYDDESDNFDYFQQTVKRLVEFNQIYYQIVGNRSTRHRGERFNIFFIREPEAELDGMQNYVEDVKQEQMQAVQAEQQQQQQVDNYNQINQNVVSSFENKIKKPLVAANLQESVGSLLINSNNLAHLQAPKTAKSVFDQAGSTDSLQASNQHSREQVQSSFPTQSQGLDAYLLGHSMKKSTSQAMSASNNSFVTIKAKDDNKKIQLKIQSIQINSEQIQNIEQSGIYCTFQYGENKIILIKSVEIDQDHEEDQQVRQQKYEQGKRLLIKMYQKQIHAFKDKFLGKGEIQISKSDIYTIEMHDQQSNRIGSVKLVVEII